MGSFKRNNGLIFDEVRRTYVPATGEEIIRQKLLTILIHRLGFPKNLLAVEKQLSELPHLSDRRDLPERRIDIICFAKEIHSDYSLYPLLLIECKEGEIGKEAIDQVLGYNHYVQARFVAVAGNEGAALISPIQTSSIPSFNELMQYASNS